jgi:hypothetical protein
MTEQERKTWEQVRAHEKKRFILSGLLSRGLRSTAPAAAIFLLIFFVGGLVTHRLADLFSPFLNFLKIISLFPLLALLVGWGDGIEQWSKNEREYKRMPGPAKPIILPAGNLPLRAVSDLPLRR